MFFRSIVRNEKMFKTWVYCDTTDGYLREIINSSNFSVRHPPLRYLSVSVLILIR